MNTKINLIFNVNAFISSAFLGNPASVCVMDEILDIKTCQAIAAENQFPVTAFIFSMHKDNRFFIRWFTPSVELPLCGHGTLAAAFVIYEKKLNKTTEIIFESPRAGKLKAFCQDDKIVLNFPVKPLTLITCPENLSAGLGGIDPEEIYDAGDRLLIVLEKLSQVKQMQPQIELLKKLSFPGIVVTAIGESVDFVSRTFYPHKSNWEDAVTGASHCALVPYWSRKLKKKKLHAIQVSPRGGELFCENRQDRVLIGGQLSWCDDKTYIPHLI